MHSKFSKESLEGDICLRGGYGVAFQGLDKTLIVGDRGTPSPPCQR